MSIHGVISSYFGDNELDVGKSVTWTKLFCDTEFILDAQVGFATRNFVVDWAKTFPDVSFQYLAGVDFLDGPEAAAVWRKASFDAADAHFSYSSDDWVLFVDATEGISVDDFEPPGSFEEDYDVDPFKAYVLEEISGAGPSKDVLYLPTWAFTRDSNPFKVFNIIDPALDDYLNNLPAGSDPSGIYFGLSVPTLRAANTTETVSAYSYYTYAGMLPRLIRVSALRSAEFDWSLLDTFVEDSPASPESAECSLYLSLISYAYARWAEPPDIDQSTGLAVLESKDIGYQMRQAISRVRSIPGLGTTSWSTADTAAEAAPAQLMADLVDSRTKASLGSLEEGPEFSTAFSSSMMNFYRREVPEDPDEWEASIGLNTPLYDTTFRSNPREGIFYQKASIGPVPWDKVTGQPAVDPDVWDYSTMIRDNPVIGRS